MQRVEGLALRAAVVVEDTAGLDAVALALVQDHQPQRRIDAEDQGIDRGDLAYRLPEIAAGEGGLQALCEHCHLLAQHGLLMLELAQPRRVPTGFGRSTARRQDPECSDPE
ncbi:MAG: hypothetical protein EXS08_08370 [Planctomycetes bacterium]|nr:hypothetical protein [Planctomycetota bacterium]